MADLIVIKTFMYRHEAELAKGLLTERGIDAIVSADDVGGFRPHLTFTGDGVRLLVKKEDVERANEALEVLENPKE